MLIQYTPEETKRLEEMRLDFAAQLLNAADVSEKNKILLQFQTDRDTYTSACELKRFKALGNDPEAILENGKSQVEALLDMEYNNLINYSTAEDLKKLGIGFEKDGNFYLSAQFMGSLIKDELKLHIEALAHDPDRLQLLLSYIVETIENSDYTDNAEINLAETPQSKIEIMRFRRRPLADLETYALMNDKANARMLQDGDIFQQNTDGQLTVIWNVNQAPQAKEQVACLIALTYTGENITISKKMTAFDKAVYEAAGTRFYYWRQENPQKPLYITPQEIWRTMNGKRSGDGKASPSEKQLKRICESLDKMRFTRLYMDISAEVAAGYIAPDEKITGGTLDTYLINATKVEFTTDKGNVVQGYRIAEDPALFYYNGLKDHLLYVPYEMLNISDSTSTSENVIEFKNYLLQQIQLMKNAAEGGKRFKRNSVILLETIYKNTGILPPEERVKADYANEATRQKEIRRLRKDDRGKIEGMLDAWKAKGFIKSYVILNQNNEPLKERQQAKGYDIRI